MRHRVIMGACALLAATALSLPAQAQTPGTIRWDSYGVPHIYGADIPTVVRGLGYAQMELHAETLLNNVARARGRSAEYLGAGGSNFNVNYDTQVRTYGIAARAAAWVQNSDPFQLSVLQAFCAGVNEYAAKNPSQILPGLKAILPVVPSDITAGELNTIWYTFLTETDNVPSQISAWQAGGMAAAAKLPRLSNKTGSNGWAIGPQKTVNNDTILMGNPHLPWGVNQPISDDLGGQNFGVYQWVEANLVVGNPAAPTLNASGVTFVGGPFIGIGYSDKVGWTHTNNTIQNADLFQLTLDSTGTKYLYGGVYLPLAHSQQQLKIRQTNGSFTTQNVEIYSSIHGPVVAFDGNTPPAHALALRVPVSSSNALVTQYWNMIQSQNITQFKTAESMLQMPFFNTMAADSSSNIFYLFGGLTPQRAANTPFTDYNTIQDGTNPALLWTKTLPFTALPQATNPPGNFVANSNNPPWTSAFPPPATLTQSSNPAYSYVAPSFMDFRPQHGATFLEQPQLLSQATVLAGKDSTEMYLADRVVGDLIAYANASSNADAKAAAAILQAWDHSADAGSVGATLFEQWWTLVVADVQAGNITADSSNSFYSPHPAFTTPWDPNNPITTPSGLAVVNQAQLVADLATAYQNCNTYFGSEVTSPAVGAQVTWGASHKATLVTRSGPTQTLVTSTGPAAPFLAADPLSGPDDEFGPIRVVNPYFIAPLGYSISYGGDGYVQVIEFTPSGAQGGTVLTYGNSSRLNSPHITDQLPLFDSKTLKPALRTLSAVQAATVTTEGY